MIKNLSLESIKSNLLFLKNILVQNFYKFKTSNVYATLSKYFDFSEKKLKDNQIEKEALNDKSITFDKIITSTPSLSSEGVNEPIGIYLKKGIRHFPFFQLQDSGEIKITSPCFTSSLTSTFYKHLIFKGLIPSDIYYNDKLFLRMSTLSFRMILNFNFLLSSSSPSPELNNLYLWILIKGIKKDTITSTTITDYYFNNTCNTYTAVLITRGTSFNSYSYNLFNNLTNLNINSILSSNNSTWKWGNSSPSSYLPYSFEIIGELDLNPLITGIWNFKNNNNYYFYGDINEGLDLDINLNNNYSNLSKNGLGEYTNFDVNNISKTKFWDYYGELGTLSSNNPNPNNLLPSEWIAYQTAITYYPQIEVYLGIEGKNFDSTSNSSKFRLFDTLFELSDKKIRESSNGYTPWINSCCWEKSQS